MGQFPPPLLLKKGTSGVFDDEDYLVCVMRNGRWTIMQSDPTLYHASKSRDELAEHDLKHGHIETDSDYRIFKRGLNWIEKEKG